MGLFFHSNNDDGDYDFDRLRRDLVDEYAVQSAVFPGGLGFLDSAMLRMLPMSSFWRWHAGKALISINIKSKAWVDL